MANPGGPVPIEQQPARRSPSPMKRLGLGCSSVLLLGLMASIASPVSKAWRVRRGIDLGMAVEQVLDRAEGWVVCQASAGPPSAPTLQVRVGRNAFLVIGEEKPNTYPDRAEMARALAARMGREGEWTLTFTYLTVAPRRTLFDVRFSAEGRVEAVSDTRGSRLD